MEITVITCDRCGQDTDYPVRVTAKAIGLNRDLCPTCVDSLKAFLLGRPDPIRMAEIEAILKARESAPVAEDAPKSILGIAV